MRTTVPRSLMCLALWQWGMAGCTGLFNDEDNGWAAQSAMGADAKAPDARTDHRNDAGGVAGTRGGSRSMRDAQIADASRASDAALADGAMTTPDPAIPPGPGPIDSGPAPMCRPITQVCDDESQCCGELSCDTTSLGPKVCCGEAGATCTTENGEDCCRDLWCIDGHCGYPEQPAPDNSCEAPCSAPPALLIERNRLSAIGGSFLGICGDANHTYGFHVAAANLPPDDYSLEGAVNAPVCPWHAAAIDIGMDWPVSRDWLRWLIAAIRADTIKGIAEVIGSYDGQNVRYWSDSSGWGTDGMAYTGMGHDSWTHVAVYRSTTLEDHHILDGWTATSGP
jgi:hypothetical protein